MINQSFAADRSAVEPCAVEPCAIELVICTYNNAPLLEQTLAALAQQVSAHVHWGVLVVNNNCTDETAAIVERYIQAGTIPRLRLVLETTQGLTPARLCGIKHTTADWIAFVDDDCVLQANWVEQAAQFAAQHPTCGAFGGKVVLTWETPPPDFVLNYGYCFAAQDHGERIQQRDCLVGAGMVINRKALTDCGWTSQPLMADRVGKKLISGGDVEMALRIRSAGYPLWYVPACTLNHLIPTRRTSDTYLQAMNFGLGVCQVHADAMLWAGSYFFWIIAAVIQTLRSSWNSLIQQVKAITGKMQPIEAALNGSFVRGRWVGLAQLLGMDKKKRRALMGCAVAEPLTRSRWDICHVELSADLPDLPVAENAEAVFLVFWWQAIPLGYQEVWADQLPMPASQLANLALQTITPAVGNRLLKQGFKAFPPRIFLLPPVQDAPSDLQALIALEQPLSQLQQQIQSQPLTESVSVVICTRDRPEQLAKCLQSLQQLVYPPDEIIVVDNASRSDATRQLVAQLSDGLLNGLSNSLPTVRYVWEPRPGLSVARNTGIRHATGSIVAFTDDDVEVHSDWIARLQQGFQDPQVMVVTGLVLPAELETEAQITFHRGVQGFGWECRPVLFDSTYFREMRPFSVPVWQIGAGANMALRRQVINLVGGFDDRLGAGASGCSEDSEFWYRVLANGWNCLYEPSAVIYHYHRRGMAGLQQQMFAYMRGHIAALLIQAFRYRHWGNLFRLFIILPLYYARLIARGFISGFHGRYRTIFAEILGCLSGIGFYLQHCGTAKAGIATTVKDCPESITSSSMSKFASTSQNH